MVIRVAEKKTDKCKGENDSFTETVPATPIQKIRAKGFSVFIIKPLPTRFRIGTCRQEVERPVSPRGLRRSALPGRWQFGAANRTKCVHSQPSRSRRASRLAHPRKARPHDLRSRRQPRSRAIHPRRPRIAAATQCRVETVCVKLRAIHHHRHSCCFRHCCRVTLYPYVKPVPRSVHHGSLRFCGAGS